MKALSPLIAEVLLIAFVVSVGAIIAVWVTNFTKTTTKKVGKQSSTEVTCAYGSIAFVGTPVCNKTKNVITGFIKNNGNIELGDLKLQVIYKNGSFETFNLASSISPGDLASFNETVACTSLHMIRITTNCTSPEVSDELTSEEISIVS